MVILYFCVSVINNYSLIFDIPMPLHMIFRAVRVPNSHSTLPSLIYSLRNHTIGLSDG